MRYRAFKIQNYKSLKDVSISLDNLSVFVGANASGKTNLSEALDFVGEVYRLGLESAVARKGGYENIAFRRGRRAKAPIKFTIEVDVPYSSRHFLRHHMALEEDSPITEGESLIFTHTFEFKVKSEAIDAPFEVSGESLLVNLLTKKGKKLFLIDCGRSAKGEVSRRPTRSGRLQKYIRFGPLSHAIDDFRFRLRAVGISKTELLFSHYINYYLPTGDGAIRSYQLNPRACREAGVPTPNPELSRFGANLPAMIPFLERYHRQAYGRLVPFLSQVFPGLEGLTYHYTHTKTFTLDFREKGFRRAWTSEEVSDGTIQSLAILVAIFDPRNSLVIVEEPENSLHPWGIRNLLRAMKDASQNRQIIITTHSPVVVNSVDPNQVRVVSRNDKGFTEVSNLVKLDSSIRAQWEGGTASLSEILDSGSIRKAVPAA